MGEGMTAAHCPGCTGHRVLSIYGPIVTAQFGQPCPGVDNSALVAALKHAIVAMEYVNREHPEATGWGVRDEYIAEARAALKLAGLREHAGTWITEDEDRRISADGP